MIPQMTAQISIAMEPPIKPRIRFESKSNSFVKGFASEIDDSFIFPLLLFFIQFYLFIGSSALFFTLQLLNHFYQERFHPTSNSLVQHFFSTLLIAYSASAVIVRLGFTPGFAGIMEPSTTYNPG